MRSVTLGRTGLEVTEICLGTAAWGIASPVHNVSVPFEDAVRLALESFDGPVNILDTSNNYGDGESERRIGAAIRERGGLPAGFVLQTKLDRDPDTGSFSPGRMRASIEESLTRLGLDRVPVLYLHDPDHLAIEDPRTAAFEAAIADDGPFPTLLALRDEGYADFIGVAGADTVLLQRFVETGEIDAIVTHNRFTLVDRSADQLLTLAHAAGVGVVNAAVYGGGILAHFPRRTASYQYLPASESLLAAIDAMGAACAEYEVPLIAAALQFSTRDPRIASTICGMVAPSQLAETIALLEVPIPDSLWDELDELCPSSSQWLDAGR